MKREEIFKDKIAALGKSIKNESDKQILRKVIEAFYKDGKTAEWVYIALITAVDGAAIYETAGGYGFNELAFYTDSFKKAVDRLANRYREKTPQYPAIGNQIDVVGDWVDYCHFAKYNYLNVFWKYRNNLLVADKNGKALGFKDTPNIYSNTLTETFKEFGYEINWTFKKWEKNNDN